MEVSYARINFELPAADCTEALVGVSIPVKNEVLELLEVGAVMGIVKIEVVLNDLRFDNLWLSLEEHDTDVIEIS